MYKATSRNLPFHFQYRFHKSRLNNHFHIHIHHMYKLLGHYRLTNKIKKKVYTLFRDYILFLPNILTLNYIDSKPKQLYNYTAMCIENKMISLFAVHSQLLISSYSFQYVKIEIETG